MRLVSPYTLCLLIVAWSILFLLSTRYFLFNAHQSWFQKEEQRLLSDVEFKIDNLDARNLRQLNQLYAEIQNVESMLIDIKQDVNHEQSHNLSQAKSVNNEQLSVVPGDHNAKRSVPSLEPIIALVVIACNRPDYIKQTLDTLLKYRPSAGLFPIVVSQDCGHEATANTINTYGSRVTHIKHPDLSEPELPRTERKIKNKKAEIGYLKISRHYKWALSQAFEEMNYDYVIVVEDDLLVSQDFFSYFSALRFLLDSDPSVWCVSAWNDNGKDGYISIEENDILYRTDFFPGLGWMLSKALWAELKPKWPLKFWDDWMREPEQRKDRACIRPEVSRTKTIGKLGVSTGQYFNQHLRYIVLNNDAVDFSKKNLTYLQKEVYDSEFVNKVHQLPSASLSEVLEGRLSHNEVKLQYLNKKEFESVAKRLKIMSDLRGGVPRTAYRGIVSIRYKGRRVHLTPPQPWTGYE